LVTVLRFVFEIARKWPVAALAGLALAGAGCGTTSSTQQATGAQSASTRAAPSTAGTHAPAGAPAPSSPAAGSCSATAAPGVYTAAGGPGQVPRLDAVQFVSATQGWAAGAGRVLVTRDGGRTWTSQYTGSAQLDQVDFTDASHGWAVGTNALLRTTDGGATWTALSEPCGKIIDSVHFVTPSLGYAVADGAQVWMTGGVPAAVNGGVLLTTTNGGTDWTRVASAPGQAQTACFSSAANGFLGTPGKVWHTTDGGQSWSTSFAEPAVSGAVHPSAPDIPVLECAGGNAAWVLFLGSGAALGHVPYLTFATQDARNWRVLFEESYTESAARPRLHAPDGPGSYPGPFSAISPQAAAFVGYTPPIGYGAAPLEMAASGGARLTKDGNVSGISVPEAVAFISPSQGWIVGQTLPSGDFVIVATADGGHTWTRQYQAR
jgi:photosystem II stability/assembly factor-like uncharacterized protein